MSKVYIVGANEYTDVYRIYGVFSTRKKAKAYADVFADPGERPNRLDIDEFEIDPHQELVGKKAYFVRLKKSGELVDVKVEDSPYFMDDDAVHTSSGRLTGTCFTHVYADSPEEATKVARERLEPVRYKLQWKFP